MTQKVIMAQPASKQYNDRAVAHAKKVIHDEEVGDHLRTGRSGVNTKLAAIREQDHGKRQLARKIAPHFKAPSDPKQAMKVEHEIEHAHERRSLLSGFTL